MSDECNQALTVASVVGREFDFDLLARMTDNSDDDLSDIVDEAVIAHVIEDMTAAIELYRFTHALIQQTLYEKQTSSRRARLPPRIGETLEDIYRDGLEARLAGRHLRLQHIALILVHGGHTAYGFLPVCPEARGTLCYATLCSPSARPC